jgi:hypothetical protein
VIAAKLRGLITWGLDQLGDLTDVDDITDW